MVKRKGFQWNSHDILKRTKCCKFENVFFAIKGITVTLKNLRLLVSSFPKSAGSVTVVSSLRIEAQTKLWSHALPSVKPYYAVKCNPEPLLLKKLIGLGLNFDCASLREVRDVKACDTQKTSEIIYAHPLKSDRDIGEIGKLGIGLTVVDSVEETKKLHDCNWKGSALLRIAVNDKDSKMPFSTKFGATEAELRQIAMSSKIPLTGISFHVGSGCQNPLQYKDAIKFTINSAFKTLKKYGHYPKIIDLGGGFSSDPMEFMKTSKVIKDTIDKTVYGCDVIAEPGRFIAQPCQDLFVKVIAKKKGKTGWRYVIDESLYGHFSSILFDHQKPAWFRVPMSLEDERPIQDSILFGRTCDSIDVIAKGPMEELHVGDWLYFPLMGAYTLASASEFNGFPKPYVMEDSSEDLPGTMDAWLMYKEFHEVNKSLTYMNTIRPIL